MSDAVEHHQPWLEEAAGTSLIELLVALALMSFLLLGIAPLLVMGLATSAGAQEATELTTVANDRLELLASLPFDAAELEPGGSTATSEDGYSEDPLPGQPDRFLRWEVVEESALLKRIRLAVGTREPAIGPPRVVLIETFRVDRQ